MSGRKLPELPPDTRLEPLADSAAGRSPSVVPKIRAAVRDDATAILQVRREAVLARAATHYDQAILNDWAHAVDAGGMVKRICDPDYRALVAEAAGEIIGYAMVDLSKCELQALYVKTNPIGNVGRTLLGEIENLAFETAPYLVCEASLNAEGFYQANGYAEQYRTDRVSSSGVISRVVWMKKHRPIAGPR